jgi:hypothetical protein
MSYAIIHGQRRELKARSIIRWWLVRAKHTGYPESSFLSARTLRRIDLDRTRHAARRATGAVQITQRLCYKGFHADFNGLSGLDRS